MSDSIPSPENLLKEIPLSSFQTHFIRKKRKEIEEILDGKDSRILLITGPCSLHDPVAAKEYAHKLKALSDEVEDVFCLVMRAYFEKPRTKLGWKGLMYDPWLDGSHDIATGLRWTRQLLSDIVDQGIATATEFLDPVSVHYFSDLISWSCIGARTSASQTHRQMASGLPMPVGFKNNTDGNVDVAINGIVYASNAHTYLGTNLKGNIHKIQTFGNGAPHLILRGGRGKTNYDPESILVALNKLEEVGLPKRLVIDCSHDNCYRKHENQIPAFQSVVRQILEGNQHIRGILLESNLYAGHQKITNDPSSLRYGISITDPCLDWDSTQHLIRWGHSIFNKERYQLNPSLVEI